MAIHFYEKSHPISPGDCCVGAVPENMNHCFIMQCIQCKSPFCILVQEYIHRITVMNNNKKR